jgi:hypothetical protein
MREPEPFQDLEMVAVGLELGLVGVQRQTVFVAVLVLQSGFAHQGQRVAQRAAAQHRPLFLQSA